MDFSGASQSRRLVEIPDATFQHLVALANQNHPRERVHEWLDVVFQHHREVVDLTITSSAHEIKREPVADNSTPATPSSQNRQGGYACHRCPEVLKHSRDFIRHVKQKCEPVQEWRCPDCPRKYKRVDHFRTHHRGRHFCGEGQCNHNTAAAHWLPRKAALGCGFCVCCFQSDLQGFLRHLVKHYDGGSIISDWDSTKVVESLLQQPRVHEMWCLTRNAHFQAPPETWPQLKWDNQKVAPFIEKLEHDISFDELHEILPQLLNLGLDNYSWTPQHSLTLRPAVKTDPPCHIMESMTATHLHNAAFGQNIADISDQSLDGVLEMQYPSTDLASLLSGETAADSVQSSCAPSCDYSFNYVDDFMDLDQVGGTHGEDTVIRPNMLDAGTSVDLATGPEAEKKPTNENINSVEDQSVIVTCSQQNSVDFRFPNSDRLLHVPSTENVFFSVPDNEYGDVNEATPPFNPGPPPKQYTSHKRSGSGRFIRGSIRGFQSLVNLPYIC